MRQLLLTRLPDPPPYYLDESLSGPGLRERLEEAGIATFEYERLLARGSVPDGTVFRVAAEAGYVVIAKDLAMEADELEAIIQHKTRLILLVDKTGGVFNWIASLVCSYEKCCEAFNGCTGPLVIRVSKNGAITKIRGEQELRSRYNRWLTARIARAKKLGEHETTKRTVQGSS